MDDHFQAGSCYIAPSADIPLTDLPRTSDGAASLTEANSAMEPPYATAEVSTAESDAHHGSLSVQLSEEIDFEYESKLPSDTATMFVLPTEFINDPPECCPLRPIVPSQMLPRRKPLDEVPLSSNIKHPYSISSLSQQNAALGIIPPLTISYKFDVMPKGWTYYVHPQGPIYFWHPAWRVATNANLYDRNILRSVITAIHNIFFQLSQYCSATPNAVVPEDTQLALDVMQPRNGELEIGYYFASLDARALFWPVVKTVEPLFKKTRIVRSHSHIRYVIEAEYCCGSFDNLLAPRVTLPAFPAYTKANDQAINMMSTAEHSSEEVEQFSSLIDRMDCDPYHSDDQTYGSYHVWTVGSIMAVFALSSFDNYHGQFNARWFRDDALYSTPKPPRLSFIISVLSPLLLYAPETYLHSLKTIIVGDTVFIEAWRVFVHELHNEWNTLIIIATVILATNVAFLAIPIIDDGNHSQSRSAAQILSYLSTISSTSSILWGQLLMRYHRIKGWENLDERIEDNFDFLLDIGPNFLAVLYSIPVFSFLGAFLVMCLQSTNQTTRLAVGIFTALVAIAFTWFVVRMEGSDMRKYQHRETLRRVLDKLHRCFNKSGCKVERKVDDAVAV
ncbi:hypothetical protein BDQ17DRAFT_1436195 [Cyathus striatus]|nr:hypothetical protein BDQ17DRAFT_1436195 [Cyathus striatus]